MSARTLDVLGIMRGRFEVKRDELATALAELRNSPEFAIASPAQRTTAEKKYTAALGELSANFLAEASAVVKKAETTWLSSLPTRVQRQAAVGHPSRATAVAELALLAGPREAQRLAELLVSENDASGGFGLRMALGQMDEPPAEAIALALQAGTAASQDALKELLGARRGYAHAMAAAHLGADGNDPLQVLKASNAATMVPLENGDTREYTSAEVDAILAARRMTTTCGAAGGRTKAGTACRSSLNLSPSSGLCMMHDPERVEERRAMHSAGGAAAKVAKRRAKAADPAAVPEIPKTLDDAATYFAWLVDQGARGAMDARTVHECAFALKGFQSAAEKRDMEREIKKLRDELADARKESPRAVVGAIRGQ